MRREVDHCRTVMDFYLSGTIELIMMTNLELLLNVNCAYFIDRFIWHNCFRKYFVKYVL